MRYFTADSGIRPLFGIVGRLHNVRPVLFDLCNLNKPSSFSKPHFHFLLLYFYETGKIGATSIISQLSDQKPASLIIQTNYPSSAHDPSQPSLSSSALDRTENCWTCTHQRNFASSRLRFRSSTRKSYKAIQELDSVSTNYSKRPTYAREVANHKALIRKRLR